MFFRKKLRNLLASGHRPNLPAGKIRNITHALMFRTAAAGVPACNLTTLVAVDAGIESLLADRTKRRYSRKGRQRFVPDRDL